MICELIYSVHGIGIGVNQIAICPAAGEKHQPAVNGVTASRPKRAAPAQAGRIVRTAGKRVVTVDVGPERVAFDAE